MFLFCGAPVASQTLDQIYCTTPQNYLRIEIDFTTSSLIVNEQSSLVFTQTTADKLTNLPPDNLIFAGAVQLQYPAHLPPALTGFIIFEQGSGQLALSEYFISQIAGTSLAFAPVEEIMSLRQMACTAS